MSSFCIKSFASHSFLIACSHSVAKHYSFDMKKLLFSSLSSSVAIRFFILIRLRYTLFFVVLAFRFIIFYVFVLKFVIYSFHHFSALLALVCFLYAYVCLSLSCNLLFFSYRVVFYFARNSSFWSVWCVHFYVRHCCGLFGITNVAVVVVVNKK